MVQSVEKKRLINFDFCHFSINKCWIYQANKISNSAANEWEIIKNFSNNLSMNKKKVVGIKCNFFKFHFILIFLKFIAFKPWLHDCLDKTCNAKTVEQLLPPGLGAICSWRLSNLANELSFPKQKKKSVHLSRRILSELEQFHTIINREESGVYYCLLILRSFW